MLLYLNSHCFCLQDDLRLLEDIDDVADVEDLDLAANEFDAEPIKKDEVVFKLCVIVMPTHLLTVSVRSVHNDCECDQVV